MSCGLAVWMFRRLRQQFRGSTRIKYSVGMEKAQCESTSFEAAFAQLNKAKMIFVDVRTPKEYRDGHVKDACSVPLMSDAHRHLVGWTYAHQGQADAIATGWNVFRPPLMRELFNTLDRHLADRSLNRNDTQIYVYCWRGGMRSRIVTNLLRMNGYDHAIQVDGGYKQYMNHVVWKGLERLSTTVPPFIVMHGNTGTRKTEILHALQRQNYPVLDLEGLAGHKGSVYGAVDTEPRTQKQFSVLLYHELERLAHYPFIFVEGEGRKIGYAQLPDFVYEKIQTNRRILVTATLAARVQCLQRQYLATADSVRQLHQATDTEIVARRIGKKNVQQLHQLLDQGDYAAFAEWLLVNYYDIRYRFAKQEYTYDLQVSSDDLDECCQQLMAFYDRLLPEASSSRPV
jgi:tRNA 2-selenouridine synthase